MPIVIVRTVLWPTSIMLLIAGLARERRFEVAGEIGELAGDAGENAAACGHRIRRRIGRNRAEAAVAGDHRRYALREFELHAGVTEKRAIVV